MKMPTDRPSFPYIATKKDKEFLVKVADRLRRAARQRRPVVMDYIAWRRLYILAAMPDEDIRYWLTLQWYLRYNIPGAKRDVAKLLRRAKAAMRLRKTLPGCVITADALEELARQVNEELLKQGETP